MVQVGGVCCIGVCCSNPLF